MTEKLVDAQFRLLGATLAAYRKQRDPIGDSDLYDEQPLTLIVSTTLGDMRLIERKLDELLQTDAREAFCCIACGAPIDGARYTEAEHKPNCWGLKLRKGA